MSGLVRRQIEVTVPPERAFAAFVDVQDVLNWLADAAVIGRHAGGNWALAWYADPESDAGYHSIGMIETYEPGRRLVVGTMTFSTPEGQELGPMKLVVEFESSTAGTLVTVTQADLGSEASWDTYTAGLGPGWERSLGYLKGWLEEGRRLPGR